MVLFGTENIVIRALSNISKYTEVEFHHKQSRLHDPKLEFPINDASLYGSMAINDAGDTVAFVYRGVVSVKKCYDSTQTPKEWIDIGKNSIPVSDCNSVSMNGDGNKLAIDSRQGAVIYSLQDEKWKKGKNILSEGTNCCKWIKRATLLPLMARMAVFMIQRRPNPHQTVRPNLHQIIHPNHQNRLHLH